MQEPSLLNRSLQKLRNLVTELQRSNQTLQSENRRSKQAVLSLREAHDHMQRQDKELRRVMHKMEILLSNSRQGYILMDRNKTVVSFNQMSDEVTFLLHGKRLHEGQSFYDSVPIENHKTMDNVLSNVFKGCTVNRSRKMPETLGERWFRVGYDPIAGDNGDVEYALISYIELTQEVKLRNKLEAKQRDTLAAQKQLLENEANLKAIIDHTDAMIYSLDRHYRYITFNAPLAEQIKIVFGVELMQGDCAIDLLSDESEKNEYRAYYDEALSGKPMHFVKTFNFNGQPVYLDYTLTPICTADGVIGLSCFVYNVSEKIQSEKRIVESETRFRSLIEHNQEMVTMLDINGNMVYHSPSVCRVLGYNDIEIKETTAFDLLHPDDLNYANDRFTKALAQPGVPVQASVRTRKKDGLYISAEGIVTNLLHVDGVNALVTNFRDVTERVSAERTYREIFDKASDGIFVHDIETGAVLDVNMKSVEMTGYTREELLNSQQPILCTDDPDYSIEKTVGQIQKAINEGPQVFEWKGRHKDGSVHWAEVSLAKANIAGTDRLLAYFRDINARKVVEQQLQKTFDRLQDAAKRQVDILNALPANIALLDKNGIIVSVNKAWRSFAAANDAPDDGAYIGVNYFDVCNQTQSADTDCALVAEGLRRIMAGIVQTFSHEYPCHSASEQRWFRVEIAPLNANPQDGLVVMHINITERKNAEESIRESEAHLRRSQQIAHVGSWQLDIDPLDLDASPLRWSEETFHMFGYDAGTVHVTRPIFFSHVHPDDAAFVQEEVNACIAEKRNLDFLHRIVRTDGEVRIVHECAEISFDPLTCTPLRIVGTVQDVTERKRAEQAEAELHTRLKAIFTGTTDAIMLADNSGCYQQVNPAAAQMLGYTEEELLSKCVTDLVVRVVVDETNLWDKFQNDGRQSGIIELRRKDGNVISCHYNATGNILPGLHLSILTDITERKQAEVEREQLTSELIEKNRGLEQFAYIVSHNLRSPVANIVGLSGILSRSDLQTLKRNEMMRSLNKAVGKLDDVIRDLNTTLQLKNAPLEKAEVVSLKETVANIVASLDQTMKKENALVETNLAVDEVKTIRTYLYSVLQNLITNSLKYRKPDVPPIITVESRCEADNIVITYKDNGLGMNLDKVGDKVFGMYKRFHNHVDGKGLGLFMVKTQVETLGGKITIDSKLNEGTTFIITLPE